MILKQVEIQYFGPFGTPTSIEIDPEVTVLTGRNDVGKSSILKAITKMWQSNQIKMEEVNNDYLTRLDGIPWNQDGEIGVVATFKPVDNLNHFIVQNVGASADYIKIKYELATTRSILQEIVVNSKVVKVTDWAVKKHPKVLEFKIGEKIGSILDVTKVSVLEASFLEAAFGKNFAARLKTFAQSPLTINKQEKEASSRINSKLQPYLPSSLGIKVDLSITQASEVIVTLIDDVEGHTPIQFRGDGIQKILALFTKLISIDLKPEDHLLILLDEPENSLHADAQHLLRTVLEKLAKQSNIQVIYATHSPSMINNLYPEYIRLLKRVNKAGKASVSVERNPSDGNFHTVRTYLGMTPADSLLYAPISIIVEGKTETHAMGKLFERLGRECSTEYPRMGLILSQIHILYGGGNLFTKWIPMARTQGSLPILFVDGDKQNEIKRAKDDYKKENGIDLDVVSLEKGKEFEDIVSRKSYFDALRAIAGNNDLTEERFEKWVKSAKLPMQMVFTLQLDKWLKAEHPEISYYKEAVMSLALERTSIGEVDLAKIDELLQLIEKALFTPL